MSNDISRLPYDRDYTISWLETNRSHSSFDGFMEENIDFKELEDEGLQFYFDEWISNEEKNEIYSEQLEELKNAIEGYKVGEYDESMGEIQHDDMIPVAYTTLGNKEEFEIQVTINVAEKRLESLVTGAEIEEVEYRHYDHIWQITKEFEQVEFEDLIRLEELDMDEMLNKDKLLQLRRDPSFLQEMNDLGLDIDSHLVADEYTVKDGKVSMVVNEHDGLPNFYIDVLPKGLEDEQAHRIFYEPTGDYVLLVDKEVFDPAWKREGYSVERAGSEPDSDGYALDNFNVIKDDEVVATIYPRSIREHNQIVQALNRGEDVNGWDNGMGETINIIEPENEKNTKDIELYYYNGFSEPEKIDSLEKLSFESNYLGDVTEEFIEEYESRMENGDIADFQQNQFVADYGVWVNPTKEQLQDFNRSALLDENEYLQAFEGHKKLYENTKTIIRKQNKNNELER